MRDYIRISEAAQCRLRIAHRMNGDHPDPPPKEDTPRVSPLDIGTVLEDVIVTKLQNMGFFTGYTGNYQLEVHLDNPKRVGHPDGIIRPMDSAVLNSMDFLPSGIREFFHMSSRNSALLEIKTMSSSSWSQFNRGGLDANPWLRKYKSQIIQYQVGVDKSPCLIVGMNKDFPHELAFDELAYNDNAYQLYTQYCQELMDWLEADTLPPPDHDGTQSECDYCEYRSVCPAIQSLETTPSPLTDEDTRKLEFQVNLYNVARDTVKDMETSKSQIKEEIQELIGVGQTVRVGGFAVGISEMAGRKTITIKVDEAEEQGIAVKQGESYTQINIRKVK